MSYQTILSLKNRSFSGKRVLLVGAAWMANEYCKALQALGISDVTILSQSLERSGLLGETYGFEVLDGGYEKRFPELGNFDLVILSLPEHECMSALDLAIQHGQHQILVEKPGSLYSHRLQEAHTRVGNARVRVAYNRVTYPNYWMLADRLKAEGGATSVHYMITELVHTIPFGNNPVDFYERWGCANTLHVISMVHALVGMPVDWQAYQNGGFDWHPSGDRFHGAGITDQDCLFSYQGDWTSPGRWGVEVHTRENSYRMIPMEQLHVCPVGQFEYEHLPCELPYPEVKQGVAEQLAVMLDPSLERDVPLIDLLSAATYTSVAETIFNYPVDR